MVSVFNSNTIYDPKANMNMITNWHTKKGDVYVVYHNQFDYVK